jgi:hypothetical protein
MYNGSQRCPSVAYNTCKSCRLHTHVYPTYTQLVRQKSICDKCAPHTYYRFLTDMPAWRRNMKKLYWAKHHQKTFACIRPFQAHDFSPILRILSEFWYMSKFLNNIEYKWKFQHFEMKIYYMKFFTQKLKEISKFWEIILESSFRLSIIFL